LKKILLQERWLRDITKESERNITAKKKCYDQESALGSALIFEKLSSAGESKAGRPENRRRGCFDFT